MKTPDTKIVREVFGIVLRRKRNEQELSQEELAHRAGMTMRYISLLECNKRQPTISTIYALCTALNISMSDFMEEVESNMRKKTKKVKKVR